MNMQKTKQSTRLSLDSFKAAAGAASVEDQVRTITGGTALAVCHTGQTGPVVA